MGSSLGGNQGMNLVDDDRVNRSQSFGRLRSQQEVEGLRRGDQNLCGIAAEAGALLLRRVAGPNADGRVVKRNALAASHVGDAGQRRPQIALDVDGQGFQRRNVDNLAALLLVAHVVQHEPV